MNRALSSWRWTQRPASIWALFWKTLIPDQEVTGAEAKLAKASWRRIIWRHGTKGPLRAKFAAVRVQGVNGPEVRLQGWTGSHMPKPLAKL
jgi:hypothetical protein